MTELRDRLAELAARGEARGADAVVAAAVADAERRATGATPGRRRRTSALVALAAVVALAVVVGLLTLRGAGPAPRNRGEATSGATAPPTSSTLPRPSISFRAGDFERVAWVDGRGLVTASSTRPKPHVVATGLVAQPAFSADGRWLAYMLDGSLHVMRADGGGDLDLGQSVRPFAWSPAGARLAWPAGTDSLGQLRVTDPASAETTTIHGTGDVTDFAWSPDGHSLAIARLVPGAPTTGFEIVDADGSRARSVAFAPATTDYHAGGVNVLLLAGWQPDERAVLVWIDPGGSGSSLQDGVDLWFVPVDGGSPHRIGKMLPKREWVRWSPDGEHLTIVTSFDRMVNDGTRTVTMCTTAGECTPLTDADVASMDPAWSPDGRQLAYVSKPAHQPMPTVEQDHADWRALYAARSLWVANADGTDAHEVTGAGDGVASPSWSGDGTRLLFVRDDSLWSIDVTGGRPIRVLGPVAPVPAYVSGATYQGNLAPPDAPYEAGSYNGYPTWESLLTWQR